MKLKDRLSRLVRAVLWLPAIYLVLNLLYAGKSLLGIDLFPGHHGGLFPLGDYIWNRYRTKPSALTLAAPYLSFAGPYVDIGLLRANGSASGRLSAGWHDGSTWSPVQVRYSQIDLKLTHMAQARAQSVTIKLLGKGATWQITQKVEVIPGAKYRVSAAVHSDGKMSLGLGLRILDAPYSFYISKVARLNVGWNALSVSGTLPLRLEDPGKALFVLFSHDRGGIILLRSNLELQK